MFKITTHENKSLQDKQGKVHIMDQTLRHSQNCEYFQLSVLIL